uniref:Ig-like domain-containing protein n=1 Tax=Pyxicephalus adspersus TaxID=30357 RepID=A0AAV3AI43_PYXAD|nr:TPA: hypothetical protein GDO54_013586 [Pyxicephalus adspersus]
MNWVRQFPSGELQWVSYISAPSGSTKEYHDSVKGRFTISRDNSNSLSSLKMENMKTEDSAVYYCARHTDKNILSYITKTVIFLPHGICRWQHITVIDVSLS